MVSLVLDRLRDDGIDAVPDVPFMSRCIDLVIFLDQDCINVVEFKLIDWRRGIVQARDHLLGADHAYVCLPVRKPSSSLLVAFEDSGVGLLFFDPNREEPFQEVVSPRRSDTIWPPARNWLIQAARAGVEKGESAWGY